MADLSSVLADFKASLPDAIAKPTLMGNGELQQALSAKWGDLYGLIHSAGKAARDRYGEDVRIGTSLGGYDLPRQVSKGAIQMSRPGKPNVSIAMESGLDVIVIDGVTYGAEDKAIAAKSILDRIAAYLASPLD